MKIRSLLDINRRHLGFICLCVITVILIAGLWPFDFNPVNKVERLQNSNGIRFYRQGIVFSEEPIVIHDTTGTNAAVTIEVLIRPHRGRGYRPILTFYDRDQEQLIIGQWKKEFYIRVPQTAANSYNHKRYREIGIDNVLEEDQTHLMSVISRNEDTAIYIDGKLVNDFPNFSLMTDDRGLSGTLILGNSPDGMHTWNGTFLGLAIYNRFLNSEDVLDHYHEWQMETKSKDKVREGASYRLSAGKPASRLNTLLPAPIALYLFDEHGGERIRNHSSDRNHLLVPMPFQPFRRTILEMPTREQWFTRSNLMDVSINILGFVPFGFFLAAWLQKTTNRPEQRVLGISILVGFCISITIELAQAYLPTRDSSLLDVINNVLGTAAGVFLLKFVVSIHHKNQR